MKIFLLRKIKKHSIDVVVDRLQITESIRVRLTDSLETALKMSTNGTVIIDIIDGEEMVFSEVLACADCGISYNELSPRMFSFNNPFGACENCNGLGMQLDIDPKLCIPDQSKSIKEGRYPLEWCIHTGKLE
jgi:excinuclease ABC subunit A